MTQVHIRQTSINAFLGIQDTLSQRQQTVLDAIRYMGEACNLDIAYYLKQPINRITPRTNELVKLGKVVESKRDICPRTGKRVIYWKVLIGGENYGN